MTTHRIYDIACALAIVAVLVSVMQIDAVSAHTEAMAVANEESAARIAAVQAKREWQARVLNCHRSLGPQTEPVEDEDGNFFCRDASGRKVAMK